MKEETVTIKTWKKKWKNESLKWKRIREIQHKIFENQEFKWRKKQPMAEKASKKLKLKKKNFFLKATRIRDWELKGTECKNKTSDLEWREKTPRSAPLKSHMETWTRKEKKRKN